MFDYYNQEQFAKQANTQQKLVDIVYNQLKASMPKTSDAQQESIGNYIEGKVSLESEAGSTAKAYINTIDQQIESTIDLLISIEDFKNSGLTITDAQRQAARWIAPIAANPHAYGRSMSQLKPVTASGEHVARISAEHLGLDELADASVIQAEISTEAYDGQKKNNAMFLSIVYNLMAAKQDAFSEAFFATVAIDPLQEGIKISQELTSVYREFARSVTGTPDAPKFNRSPLIKEIYNKNIFGVDKHRIVPVYRESDNADFFVSAAINITDKSSGQDIVTRPLLFGKEVSLLGISQTDDILAKGVMDNTDALDRTLKLDNVYFNIDDEYFCFNAQLFPYSNFVGAPQGHHKELQLMFNVEFPVNITSITKWDGSTAAAFSSLSDYEGYIAILKATISGSANTMTSDTSVNVSKVDLKEIRNAAGQLVATTDTAYTAIKAVTDKIEMAGYTLEAYRTNSNVRTRGVLVTTEPYEDIIIVPYRSGSTVISPVNNAMGQDNDVGFLTSQLQLTGIRMTNAAVQTLINIETGMNMAKVNGSLDRINFYGLGRHYVQPYFNNIGLDLTDIVDSVKSSDRADDIRQALRLKIKEEVLRMVIESNYGVAFETIRKGVGGRMGIIVGTDPYLKSLICKEEEKFILDGTDYEVTVVSTWHPDVAKKIFVTFGVFDENRNSACNPLNFGSCIWSPTISYEVVKTHTGSVSRELHNNPRFVHVAHLPILSVFNISDVTGIYDKIAIYIQNQD